MLRNNLAMIFMLIVLFITIIGMAYTVVLFSQANINAVQCEITSTHYSGFSYYGNLRNYISKPCE